MANYKTYHQYDSRWGWKNYNGSSNMSQAGCGPTSVADLAYAIDKSVTPWTVAKYMQKNGYAIRNNGTAWAGIPAAMKHFGLMDVKNVASMSDVFSYLKKRYCAVFLFKGGSRGGITWTLAGHYLAVTSIKVEDGKHYLYMRDPGGRNHTGRYCYETQMKGLISQVWVGYVPGNLKTEKKKETKKKETKKTTKKSKAQKLNDRAIKDSWAKGTPPSKYRYPTGAPKAQYKKDLDKAYPKRSGWWKQTRAGAACDVFVPVVIRVTGVDKSIPHGLEYMIPYLEKTKKLKIVPSKDGGKKGHYYPPSLLKGGDIVVLKYKGGGAHTFFVVEVKGKKYVAEAQFHGKTWPHISNELTTLYKSKYKMLRVYRAVE